MPIAAAATLMRADARTAAVPMAADTHPVIAGGMATAAVTVTVEDGVMVDGVTVAGVWASVTGLDTMVIPITDTRIPIIQPRTRTIILTRMRTRIQTLTYIAVLSRAVW
jgi:hypothetical protein